MFRHSRLDQRLLACRHLMRFLHALRPPLMHSPFCGMRAHRVVGTASSGIAHCINSRLHMAHPQVCVQSFRAGLAQLADSFVSDPAARFAEGQSVRAQVASLDAAKQRFTLSLKHSAVAASDAAYLRALLADLEAAEAIRCRSCPCRPFAIN